MEYRKMDRAPGSRKDQLAKLSQGQMACLCLVREHLTSKEIAAQFGISRHTVDQRIRLTLKILGVEKRSQAARLMIGSWTRPEMRGPETKVDDFEKAVRSQLPFATTKHPQNTMNSPLQLGWIVIIAIYATISVAMGLAGLGSLSRMMG